MITKGSIALKALRKAGIASSTSLTEPEPEAVQDALSDLEDLATQLDADGVRVGFMLADPEYGPDPDDDSGLPDWAVKGFVGKLAESILIDNLRPVPQALLKYIAEGMRTIKAKTVYVPTLERRNDMPVGQGYKTSSTGRFYVEPSPVEDSNGVPLWGK